VLDTLQGRVGVNVLMLGTVSWLGLKAGRSISHKLDGWPDHGVPEPFAMKGGAYFDPDPRYYRTTFIDDYKAKDVEMEGVNILETVIPAARARGMKVFVELMEPFFKYAGHGSVNNVAIPNLPQVLEVDVYGRMGGEPSTSHPAYRQWIHSMVEDQVRNYDLDGVMWCNERRSPLDQMIAGPGPGRLLAGRPARGARARHRRRARAHRDAERVGLLPEGARRRDLRRRRVIEFLRVLLANPEVLIWERFWLERNKDLDRELYGLVKWCEPRTRRSASTSGTATTSTRSARRSGRGKSRPSTPTGSSRSPTSTSRG
jgi:hypothetical protein